MPHAKRPPHPSTARRHRLAVPRAGRLLAAGLSSALLAVLLACATPVGMPEPLSNRRDIAVTAWSWGYEPAIVQVHQGQRIRMTLTSLDVAHGLVNEQIGVNAAIPARGEPAAVYEFTAPTLGEYILHSTTPSGPGISQMKMRLVVMR